MKYEIEKTEIGKEVTLSEELYSIDITIYIKPTDNIAPVFTKVINVESNNNQTGFEVDQQRADAVNEYLILINI